MTTGEEYIMNIIPLQFEIFTHLSQIKFVHVIFALSL